MLRKYDRVRKVTIDDSKDRRERRRDERRLEPLRRFKRRVLVGMSLLLAAVAFAPQLLGLTGAGAWLFNQATASLPGSVQVDDFRLGWLRPVQLDRLRLLNDEGQPLAAAQTLRTELPLWRLVTSRGQLGIIHVDGAELWVHVRPGGSNWEDYLATWPANDSARRQTVQTQLQVHRGTVHVADPSGRVDQVRDLEAWLDLPATATPTPITFAAQAAVSPADGAAPGHLQVQGSWQDIHSANAGASAETGGPRLSLESVLDSFPLNLTHHAALRYQQPRSARGVASGKFQVQLRPTAAQPIEQLTAELNFAPLQIDLQGPSGALRNTGTDEIIQLSTASVRLKIVEHDGRTIVEECDIASPVASVALSGQMLLVPLRPGDLRAVMEQPAFQLRGQIDLAALAQQAPRAMRLRDDVQLVAGSLQWEIVNQSAKSDSQFLSGRIESRGLTARRGDETLQLDEPIQFEFQLGTDQRGPFAQLLQLRAPFLHLDAQGRFQQGQLQVESDLSRLTRELGQYFELGQLQLAGQLRGQAQWQTTPEQVWQVEGDLHAENLHVAGWSAEPWTDPQLQVEFQGTGRFDGWQLASLDTATIQSNAGSDHISVRLTSPIAMPSSQSQWPLDARLAGDLARWRSRLSWMSATSLPPVTGQIELRTTLDASPSVIRLSPLELSLRDLTLVLAGDSSARVPGTQPSVTQRTLTEPSVELTAQAIYHVQDRQLICESGTLASTSISGKAESLRLAWGPVPRVDGTVHFRGDLEKLWHHAGLSTESRASGEWTGQARLLPSDKGWSVEATSQIAGFQWQQRDRRTTVASGPSANYVAVWQEPHVQLGLTGVWPASARRLEIASGTFQTESFAVRLVGTVDAAADPIVVDVQGRSNLNLDLLSARLRPWLGNDILLSGTSDEPLWFKGPITFAATAPASAALVPPELEGQARIAWQSLQAFGFGGGAAALDARLRQQVLLVEPFEIPVSQGTLRLAPRLELFGLMRVVVDKGPVIQQVSITPEMCQRWLKYVAPLVADATAAEGRLSLQLARAELPLRAPRNVNAAGALTIHQAHIGPGPLARELLTLAQTINTLVDPGRAGSRSLDANARWIELPEQAVSFRVENGQVAHNNLTMQIGEVTIRTRGWVGFDQRLGLVADIPVQDRWIANQPYLAGLRGQTLSVPVNGTLQRPVLDQRALQSLTQQTVRGAAQGLLQQELQRQLEQLLPKK